MGSEQELCFCVSYSALPCLGCEGEHQPLPQFMFILGFSSLGSPLAPPQHSCGPSKEQLHTCCAMAAGTHLISAVCPKIPFGVSLYCDLPYLS